MILKKDRLPELFTLLALFGCFSYVFYRASALSITHDEALSYLHFAWLPKSYWEIITYKIPTTNNHLLNSILMRWFTSHFGNSEIIIRTPNLIGYAFYLSSTVLILRMLLRRYQLLLGILFLALHPFLIGYFSCARGYGLGLGFMMAGIFFSLKSLQTLTQESRLRSYVTYAVLAYFSLFLATLSNLIFLHLQLSASVILIFGTLFLGDFKKRRRQILSNFIAILITALFGAITFLIYSEPIKKLSAANEFYHGGKNGFWSDSVQSLITATIHGQYHNSLIPVLFLSILIVIVVVLSTLFIFKVTRKDCLRENPSQLVFSFVFWMIFLCWIGIELQNLTLKTIFPIDRGVIYFIPLFSLLCLTFTSNGNWFGQQRWNDLIKKAFLVVIGLSCLHYAYNINTSYFLLNKPDAHTKEVIQYLEDMNRNKIITPQSQKFGIHWWFEPAINYYLLRNKIPWFGFVTREGFDGEYDYYYVRAEDKWIIEKYNLKVLKHYSISDTYLAVPQNT